MKAIEPPTLYLYHYMLRGKTQTQCLFRAAISLSHTAITSDIIIPWTNHGRHE
jgi:hypothetical protein